MNASNYTDVFQGFKESTISLTAKLAALLMFGGLGAVGNIFVIVLAVKYTVWRNLHHLIINMAVADTLVFLFKTFFGVMRMLSFHCWNRRDGVLAVIQCKMLPFFTNVFVYESLVTLLVITVERFRVTRLTVQRSRPYTLKQRAIVLACCWLISMVPSSFYLLGTYRYTNFRKIRKHYKIIMYAIGLIIIILVFFIFILSIITLRRLSKPQAIQDHLSESQRQARTKRTRCAIRMVLCSMLLYTCCYLPIFIVDFAMHQSIFQTERDKHDSSEYVIYFLLPVINSCFSPCIYIVFLAEFREAAKRLLKCRRTTNQRANGRITCSPQPQTAEQTADNQGLHFEDGFDESQTTSM